MCVPIENGSCTGSATVGTNLFVYCTWYVSNFLSGRASGKTTGIPSLPTKRRSSLPAVILGTGDRMRVTRNAAKASPELRRCPKNYFSSGEAKWNRKGHDDL